MPIFVIAKLSLRAKSFGAVPVGLRIFEPTLFTVPCKYCGEPMVFTHKDQDRKAEVRPRRCDGILQPVYKVLCLG
ncbi:MAG: hypothetical protein DRZ82_08810 [Thermoprotei archaeon]|nr:MAG: hypothetical protein DRZ82_08810 [Thermoprotei archaeon]